MVNNTENHWVSELCPLSGVLNISKTHSREGRETPSLLGPLVIEINSF
jgi:hypothetical protein